MSSKIRNIIIIFFMVLLSACGRDGPLLIDVSTENISGVLDESVPPLMEKGNVVGMSIIVIRGGNIAISKSFGDADSESHRKVDEQTVFRAASGDAGPHDARAQDRGGFDSFGHTFMYSVGGCENSGAGYAPRRPSASDLALCVKVGAQKA